MRTKLFVISMLAAILLQGCSGGPDVELILNLESDKPVVIAETRDILTARFSEFRPSLVSSVQSQVEGSQVRFVFSNGAPEDGILEYLYSTPGALRASQIDAGAESTWFTTRDIESAKSGLAGAKPVLHIRLEPDAAERVAMMSRAAVGQRVQIALDGQVMLEARVAGVFGREFQVNAPVPERARELAVIFKTGVLPTRVTRHR